MNWMKLGAVVVLMAGRALADEDDAFDFDFGQKVHKKIEERFRRYGLTGPMLGVITEAGEGGASVVAVTPNGPAEQAGIRAGDTITSVDSVSLEKTGTRGLVEAIHGKKAGEVVTLQVVRKSQGNTQRLTISATLKEGRGFQRNWSWAWGDRDGGSSEWDEVRLVPLNADLGTYFGTTEGMLVVSAPSTMPLKGGDVLLKVGDRVPKTAGHAVRILGSYERGEKVPVEILRQRQKQTLMLTVP